MEQQQQQKIASPSQQDPPPIAAAAAAAAGAEAEEEVSKTNEEVIPSSSAEAEAQVDDLFCLSGDKPFFDIILSKSHVSPTYTLSLPSQALLNLPRDDAVVVFVHGGKEWKLEYNGKSKRPRFLVSNWKTFVEDNDLKCDDACIFEVLELSPTAAKLKVVILRGTDCLPPELQSELDLLGMTPETAIEID